MKVSVPPSDPENQASDADPSRVSLTVHTVRVFVTCSNERDTAPRLMGRVCICPGIVAPGHLAAVRAPDGSLKLRRIYYERIGGMETVRLESLVPGTAALRFALKVMKIKGAVICACRAQAECPCVEE